MKSHLFIAACACLMTLPAFAKDRPLEKLEERLAITEQSLQDLQESIRNQGTDTAGHLAVIEQIRADWNGYQGVVDAISQQQQLLINQLQKYMDEFEGRISSVETAMSDAGINKPESPELSESTPEELGYYHDGLSYIRDHDYASALKSFQQYTRSAKDSALVANAHYWVAECQYAMGQYQKAIKAYTNFAKKYPEHEKTPNAQLKQGQALAALNMTDEAKAQYTQIVQNYPGAPIAYRAQTRLNLLNQDTATATRDASTRY